MKKIINTISEQIIFQDHTGGYREYRIPGILKVQDGLLLTCEARAEESGDWGDIDVMVLRLEGEKEPMEVLKVGESALPKDGTMRTYNNPVLVPDGEKVHLIYHRNYERAFIVTSPDGGRSWGKSREITESYREFPYEWNVCASGPGHGIQLKNGRLVVPIWLANGQVHGQVRDHWPSVCGCIYSDDHGKTWHAGALAAPDNASVICSGNETAVVVLPDGRLLFNHRNMNPDRHRMLALSADGGETMERIWSARDLPDPMCFGGMAMAGEEVLFANCNTQTGRVDLTVKGSYDAGKSWEIVWEADPVGGYADIAADGQKVFLFYERTSPKKGVIEALILKTGMLEEL